MGARPHTGGGGKRTALAVAAVSLLAWLPLKGRAAPPSAPTPDPGKGEVLAKRLCGECHLPPPPDILPRTSWRKEIVKMSLIRAAKEIPAWGEAPTLEALSRDHRDVLAYYEAKAPVALAPSPPWPAPEPLRFVRHAIGFKDALTPEPAVANVRLGDLDRDGRPEVLACDMRQGLVLYANPAAPERGLAPLAMVPHPDHVTLLDLGGSRQDLLVADLGGFFPGDHDKGAAIWLRALPGGRYSPFTLPGLPRVADVEAADFDSDGRPDLLVAAFGWWRQGGIFLFLNRTTEGGQPSYAFTGAAREAETPLPALVWLEQIKRGRFERHTIARGRPRYPTLDVGDVDLDGDLDLVAGVFLLQGQSASGWRFGRTSGARPFAPDSSPDTPRGRTPMCTVYVTGRRC